MFKFLKRRPLVKSLPEYAELSQAVSAAGSIPDHMLYRFCTAENRCILQLLNRQDLLTTLTPFNYNLLVSMDLAATRGAKTNSIQTNFIGICNLLSADLYTYIIQRYGKHQSIEAIAEHAGTSMTTVRRRFDKLRKYMAQPEFWTRLSGEAVSDVPDEDKVWWTARYMQKSFNADKLSRLNTAVDRIWAVALSGTEFIRNDAASQNAASRALSLYRSDCCAVVDKLKKDLQPAWWQKLLDCCGVECLGHQLKTAPSTSELSAQWHCSNSTAARNRKTACALASECLTDYIICYNHNSNIGE